MALLAQSEDVVINIGKQAVEQQLPHAESDWETAASSNFGGFISRVFNIVLVIATIAVLFYLVMGGLEWLTSGGDKSKTESARNKITQAIVGLVILVGSWAILLFVQQLLGIGVFQR